MGRRTKEEYDLNVKMGKVIVAIVMVPTLTVILIMLLLIFGGIEP